MSDFVSICHPFAFLEMLIVTGFTKFDIIFVPLLDDSSDSATKEHDICAHFKVNIIYMKQPQQHAFG